MKRLHCIGLESFPLTTHHQALVVLALDERPAHPESPDLVGKLSASQPGVSASSSHSACPSSMRPGQGLDRTAAASTVASPASPAWDRHTLLQQPTILVAKDCKHTKTHKISVARQIKREFVALCVLGQVQSSVVGKISAAAESQLDFTSG